MPHRLSALLLALAFVVPCAHAAPVSRLVWTTLPASVTNGQVFAQSPVLQTADASGTPSTTGLPATKIIQIGLYSGRGILTGTLTTNIGTAGANGTVTFSNLQISQSGAAQLIAYDLGTGSVPINIVGGASCQLWLDAADRNTQILSGSHVATWLDKSGKSNNATGGVSPVIATNSTLAQTASGLSRTVRFDGANTYLNVNLSSLSNSAYTIIAMEVATSKSSSSSYILGNNNGGQDATLHIGYNTPGEWRWGEYGDDLNYDTTFTYPTPRISTERITSALAESLYFNSVNVMNRPAGALLGGTFLSQGTVGRAINSGNYQGDLAELIVFNTALSTADRTNVEGYLATKWSSGLTCAITPVFNVLQTNGMVFQTGLHEVIPTLNTNEIVIAVTSPQEYGAVGDGITDDSAAFQNAINAAYNSGGSGGGVVFVPNGNYAFYTNLTIPTGVTLHGDWTDWTKGTNGLVGTTFKIYVGAGQTNGTPFITMSGSSSIKDLNLWYPDQNATNLIGYPFTISLVGDCVAKNIVLVNSYSGIQAVTGDRHILSTVIGTPLYLGAYTDSIFDICHAEDVRFSPEVWPASHLTNAPAPGDPYAAWMRANGTGWRMVRVDGDICMDTFISGYNVGILFTNTGNGDPGITFYSGAISNCAVAVMTQAMPTGLGLMFADFTLDGDIAVKRTRNTADANVLFDHCTIIGRNGPAVSSTGADSGSWMQFQNCTISNTLALVGPGVFNVVNCSLNGIPQASLASTATRAAFIGCTFSPVQNILNSGSASNLLVDARQPASNPFPMVYWTNILNDYNSRQPARTNLFVATSYGATGNGVTDDTVAINHALAAAGANGGGIVYLPAGLYHLTNTLDVPGGVELRGAYELRHWPAAASDGFAKGSVLRPYGGQGTTNGPVAVALQANSGLVGVTISYETQNTNCIVFPPAIQGRGSNIYAIGIACPNPYYYLDLDTYTCANHFIYLADGWTLKDGFNIGNGSSGSVIDCMGNWTYWINNGQSQSTLPQSIQAPVLEFVLHQSRMYTLGNCTELFANDFNIIENTYLMARSESGIGPTATFIGDYCDATIRGMILDAGSNSTINAVNTTLCVFNVNNDADLASTIVDVFGTTNNAGTARFFNTSLFAQPFYDINLNGGDVGFEALHIDNSVNGSLVNGGVLHFVNASTAVTGNPPYTLTLGTNAGIAGKSSDFIGTFSLNGVVINNLNVTNPITAWTDYALSTHAVLNLGAVIVGDIYPDGAHQFEPAGSLSFMAFSSNGINPSGVSVQLTATNLLGQNFNTTYTTANGLAITGSSTTKSVNAPLVTNAVYVANIKVTDATGNVASNTVAFDTISPALIFEAEDFDYGGGNFVTNYSPDCYSGLIGISNIDYSNLILGQGNNNYRPQGLETEGASDQTRVAFNGAQDFDVGFANTGNWGNYTRQIPSGVYNIYLRAASPSGPTTDGASLSLVVAGQRTTNQTITKLGTFNIPNTGGYQTYAWASLKDSGGNLVKLQGGSTDTLRATTDRGGFNVNCYLLVTTNSQSPLLVAPPAPANVVATSGDGQIILSWTPTVNAIGYQVKRANALQGPYSIIASNLTNPGFTNTGLTNGTTYYFTVAATNAIGVSPDSSPVSARAVASAPPQITSAIANGQLQFAWGADHTGWRLETQTNDLNSPLGTNWIVIAGSAATNQITLPVDPTAGTVFFRLIYP